MRLKDLLTAEGMQIENKLKMPGHDLGFLKTVVAFANGQGGRFHFGVRDEDHAVLGMSEETLFQDMDAITSMIADNCVPPIIPNVYPQTIEDKTIIVVEIPVGRQRPYYIKRLGMMEGTFIRLSAETRQAPEYMVKELMFEGTNRHFDKTVCLGLEVSDRDIARLCRSLRRTARENCLEDQDRKRIRTVTPAQLLSWGVLTQHDGQLMPTNAYALLTGHWLLPSITQCALFKGKDKRVFLEKRELEGPIQEQQEQALQFVLRNIHLGARIRGLYRQDIYEIPPVAIRELLINCVVHRSYLDRGSIQVAIYDDRLEVFCPGKLPLDQTVERMQQGVSKIRNEALARAFAYMGLIEGWGSGIQKINDALQKAGLQRMEIVEGGTFMRFVIWRDPNFNPEPDLFADAEALMELKSMAKACAKRRKTTEAERKGRPDDEEISSVTTEVERQKGLNDEGISPKTTEAEGQNGLGGENTSPKTTEVTTEVRRLLGLQFGEASAQELMGSLALRQREDFRSRYLRPALHLGIVEMTHPEAPRSPAQRYRLTDKGLAWQRALWG